MSFDALHERLSALQDTTAQLKELIDRLAHLQFEPGSVPLGADDEDNVAAELSTEINQVLREEEEDLELLQEEVIDLRSGRPGSEAEHNKIRLTDGVSRLDRELKTCRVAFRKAQLSARHSLQQARRLDREILLATYAAGAAPASQDHQSGTASPTAADDDNANNDTHQPQQPDANGVNSNSNGSNTKPASSPREQRHQLFPPNYRRHQQQRKKRGREAASRDGAVVAASSDVTAALRRTHDLIAGEVSRSAFARQTLAESTAALGALRESYAGLEGLLASSRELAGALLTSTKSDTWYLETAVYMLLATLAWLVFRRWLYGPLWWVLWLPLRTAWRTGSAVSRVGSGVGGGEGRVPYMAGPVGGVVPEEVVGHEDGSVPTVRVGEQAATSAEAEPDSLVHKVARMVEDKGSGAEQGQEEAESQERPSGPELYEDYEPNPMKRMWDEGEEAKKLSQEGVRDEL